MYAHELTEIITSPKLADDKAWLSGNYENADLCSWEFLVLKSVATGEDAGTQTEGVYNYELGGSKYLIQSNWSAKTQKCE